jgi:predicted ATPase/DNA-binding SARP family transcriptional activator
VEFRLLGPLEIVDDGELITPSAPIQRALLAVLLLNPRRVVSSDALIEAVWGEEAGGVSPSTLRYHISKCRDSLGCRHPDARHLIVTRSPGYSLDVPAEALDSTRFEHLTQRGRSLLEDDPTAASRLLGEALALFRGPPLAEFTYREFAAPEIRRLEELRLAAVEDRIGADLARGHHEDVLGELQGLVRQHPWRERLWARLMVALYRCGRQAEALRAYQEARRVLGEGLGIEPSEELRRVEEQVLLSDPALLDVAQPPAERPRLPQRLTPFIGRRDETDVVTGLLEEHRLVTVVGAPGSGKTRLALEVAERWQQPWVWFADLAGCRDLPGVLLVVAQAVGVAESRQPADESSTEDRLRLFLQRRRSLLLLDNCETAVSAAGALAASLLRACPQLTVLATSRHRLGAEGEVVWTIPMMGLVGPGGSPEGDALALFANRARAVDPGFVLDGETRGLAAAVCRRLDGLPLAIELAASQIDVLSLAEIAEHLEGPAFLLEAATSTPAGEQRTLRSTMDWSYQSLDPGEQRLFARLSVCVGGFDEAMAEAIGGSSQSVGVLWSLVRKSLVAAERSSGRVRYRLLEPLRWFGLGCLEKAGGTSEAHRAAASHLAVVAERYWEAWVQCAPLSGALAADVDNLRAALEWFEADDPVAFVGLVGALGWLWKPAALEEEGWRWAQRAVRVSATSSEQSVSRLRLAAALNASTATQAAEACRWAAPTLDSLRALGERRALVRALVTFGQLGEWFNLPGFAAARREALVEARDLAEDGPLAACLDGLAWAEYQSSDPGCIGHWQEAEALYQRLGNREEAALAAAARIGAEVLWDRPGERDPVAALERCLRVVLAAGELRQWQGTLAPSWEVGVVENQLRIVCEKRGDLPQAVEHGRRAVRAFSDAGDMIWGAFCLADLGHLHRRMGAFPDAARRLLEATSILRAVGRFGSKVWMLEGLAELLVAAGAGESGIQLLGAAGAIREDQGMPLPMWDRPDYEEALARGRELLGAERVAEHLQAGTSLSLEEALDLAEGEAATRAASSGD